MMAPSYVEKNESPYLGQRTVTFPGTECFGFGCIDRSKDYVHSTRSEYHRTKDFQKREMKGTEDFLAAEMNTLSIQERSKALDDVHCVGEELQEDEGIIQRSLAAFDEEVKAERNPIYELAASQNRAYVEDPAFRLKFLRAKLHDVKQSVRQMMNFLRYKATYFGEDKLARDISLSDLNQDDIDLMLSGLFHVQDGRDRSGRVVIYMFNHMLGRCKAETLIRAAYYIWVNIIIPLPEVQMKGLVGIYYDVAKPGEKFAMPGFNFMLTIMGFTASLPMRYSGAHACLKTGKGNLALNNAILGIAMNGFPKYARVRMRLHYGSDVELQYELQGHGLPMRTCPADSNGNIRQDILNAWYFKQQEIELGRTLSEENTMMLDESSSTLSLLETSLASSHNDEPNPFDDLLAGSDSNIDFEVISTTPDPIDETPFSFENAAVSSSPETDDETAAILTPTEPTPNDVLLGRGKKFQNHPGNIRFREWLDEYYDDYDHAPRTERRRIATNLTEILNAKGVRFLKRTKNNQWVESEGVEAEKKICQLFRCLRKKK